MTQFEGSTEHPGPFAVVVSRYNESITAKLLKGAVDRLVEAGVAWENIDVAWTPGAWELPLAAAAMIDRGGYAAVICLGCVIRGETSHDRYINQQVSSTLGRLAIDHRLPVLFGLLTVNSLEQALHRSGGNQGNKGRECAEAALRMADLTRRLQAPDPTRR